MKTIYISDIILDRMDDITAAIRNGVEPVCSYLYVSRYQADKPYDYEIMRSRDSRVLMKMTLGYDGYSSAINIVITDDGVLDEKWMDELVRLADASKKMNEQEARRLEAIKHGQEGIALDKLRKKLTPSWWRKMFTR